MRKYGRYLATAAFTILTMCVFYLSAFAWGELIWSRERIQLYLEQPVSANEAAAAVEHRLEALEGAVLEDSGEELPDFCIWGQREETALENKNLSRSVKAQVILFSGNPELLFEGCRVPAKGDIAGCLVDEETAWELFGSIHVVGKEITYETNTYTIRRVLPSQGKIAVFQVSGKSEAQKGEEMVQEPEEQNQEQWLNRVTLQKSKEHSVSDLLASWSARYGWYPKLLDQELLHGIGGFCVLLLPVTMSLLFLHWLCRGYRRQEGWKGKTLFAAAALSLAVLTWFLLKDWVHIPDDYIPAKWSDFSFWSSLLKEKRQAVNLLLEMPKLLPDYGWMNCFLISAGGGILAEILATFQLLFCRRQRKGGSRS